MWPLAVGSGVMKWDAMDLYLPWKFFITDTVKHGQLPLWNPYINGGFTQMGDPGTWYPISYLFGLFGYGIGSVSYEYIFHLYIAGIGFYTLGKQFQFSRSTCLILACAYMLSGLMIGNGQHIGWVVGSSWFPWVFYYFREILLRPKVRPAVMLSLTLFFMLSGGYPAFFFVTAYILLIYFIVQAIQRIRDKGSATLKKPILFISGAAVLFLLLSSVVLTSSFDLSAHIARGGGLQDEGTWRLLSGSLPAKALVSYVFPLATAHNNFGYWNADFSMTNCYFGATLLFLLIFLSFQKGISKNVRIYGGIGLFILTVALGEVFPFRQWLAYLPFMDMFRFPTLFRVFALFFFLIASGFALEHLWKSPKLQKRLSLFLLILIVALGVVAGIVFFQMERWKFVQLLSDGWHHFLSIAYGRELLFFQCSVLIALLSGYWIFSRLKPQHWKTTLIVVILVEISSATILHRYATVIENRTLAETSRGLENIPSGFPTPQWDLPMKTFTDSEHNVHFSYLWKSLSFYRKTPSLDGISPYTFFTTAEAIRTGEYDKFKELPFVFFAEELNRDGTLNEVSVDTLSYSKMNIASFSPNQVTIDVHPERNTQLILAQNNYPHWKAFIDDNPVDIKTVSHTFMGIDLPKGQHRVHFEFRPERVISCFKISLISFMSVLLYLFVYSIFQLKSSRKTSE